MLSNVYLGQQNKSCNRKWYIQVYIVSAGQNPWTSNFYLWS